jgi:methionyl-tRNA formyltransferase
MKIALVGGGEGMLLSSSILRQFSSMVSAYFSPRHGQEMIRGEELRNCFLKQDIPFSQVNSENEFAKQIEKEKFDLIFGIGPEWIFSSSTIALAKLWVNVNIIPFPKYLGGAHVTWQILNEDRRGSVVFQEMIEEVDKGRILEKFDFTYSSDDFNPELRFNRNLEELSVALPKFMSSFKNEDIKVRENPIDHSSEYWPRLKTDTHGWIDWKWSSQEIVRFILGFSTPYPGARTRLGEETITIHKAHILEIRNFHPFSAGIILRKSNDNSIVVAVRDAVLELECTFSDQLKNMFLEGHRLFTPTEDLEKAMRSHFQTKDFRVPN